MCGSQGTRVTREGSEALLRQAYSFCSMPITKALLNAHKGGVGGEVILDKSQLTEKYSSADFLAHTGIPTEVDAAHAIAYNKVMIIDEEIVITGRFNFIRALGGKNVENLLIIWDNFLTEKYMKNW
jgi:phosphatidylserine/phosphatidylglycerophosphate/cardiolipin synthase-like enzyme